MNYTPSTQAVGEWPVPSGARTVLLFGGSFDPPHIAHITLPSLARDAINADWLLYVPAARSPHKPDGPIASAPERIAMLAAALQDIPRASISTIELDAADRDPLAPSYTINTIRALRSSIPPETKLRLLIGADQLLSFHRWREPREIIERAEPVVMLRRSDPPPAPSAPQPDIDSLLAHIEPHWSPDELRAWRSRFVEVPLIDVSATEVRSLLAAPRTTPDAPLSPRLAQLLPAPVLDVIERFRLYQPHP